MKLGNGMLGYSQVVARVYDLLAIAGGCSNTMNWPHEIFQ
ncbi:Uncharacterised protein [Legionella feeleii]|uniref:Uncharacterized protein n=1 Tax=Legionella feeleii TaxID=453 RepID=A0A378IV23_9GAMM|nr:Uncharacterised protein [Legionella feeleii]